MQLTCARKPFSLAILSCILTALVIHLSTRFREAAMAERAPGGPTQSVSIRKTQLNSRTDKYVLLSPLTKAPLTFRDLLTGLATPSAAAVRSPFIGALQTSRFPAFFFETPSFSRDALDRPFEFVLVAAPSFAGMQADRSPFAAFLDAIDGTADAAVFDNLGGNAVLVAPARGRNVREDAYAHVAPFVRRAPPEQVDALWRRVGEAALKCAEAGPVRWLSTAGGGVSWLHVRLDLRPKYYTHTPYKRS